MGGIVARSVVLRDNYSPDSINAIVTLNSPHLELPFASNIELYRAYNEMNTYWKHKSNLLKEINLIAISGGDNDTLIMNGNKEISSILSSDIGFTAYTTGIPRVWSSTNHDMVI